MPHPLAQGALVRAQAAMARGALKGRTPKVFVVTPATYDALREEIETIVARPCKPLRIWGVPVRIDKPCKDYLRG